MRFNRSTLAYVALVTGFIEVVIITYNQYTGYIEVSSPLNFLIRWLLGTTIALMMAVPMVYLDVRIIGFLDRRLSWEKETLVRAALELALGVAAAVACSVPLTGLAHLLHPYRDGLPKNLVNNALIGSVVNLLLLAVVEAVAAFRRNRVSLLKARRLEEENARIRLEVLKSQLNPHFLFNSLNTLSSLIDRDPGRAHDFVDEFASVYRYTLEVIDRPAIELRKELAYAKSYLALQKVRFEGMVVEEIRIASERMDDLVPPLALQTVLENAFKHNVISEAAPLRLTIMTDGDAVIVTNSFTPKRQASERRGVGLENLKRRYAYLGEEVPTFIVTEKEYIARLPLLPPD